MKSLINLRLLLLFSGSMLFTYFFWHETFGVNVLLFSLFIISSTFLLFREEVKDKKTILLLCTHLMAAILVVFHNSFVSKLSWWISLFISIAFVHQKQLRSVLYAIPTILHNYIKMPIAVKQQLISTKTDNRFLFNFFRYAILSILPFIIVLIFYFIYLKADPAFSDFNAKYWKIIGDKLAYWFENFSFAQVFFTMLGFILLAGLLINAGIKRYAEKESSFKEVLFRKRNLIKRQATAENQFAYIPLDTSNIPMLGLKNENLSAFILLLMINALLLVVNLIDIKWIWFQFEYQNDLNLSHYVHVGTYLLILSILLSMIIMFYFFRGNQNFFDAKNKKLKLLSYAWIAQNAVMVISVIIRNYHYIHYCGLAYKRIGVFVFLALTLVGLITLWIKIQKKKTVYQVLKVNSWIAYGMLFFLSLVNWDMVIAKHNTSHPYPQNMDEYFLLSLSDKTLPTLDQHKEFLNRPLDKEFIDDHSSIWNRETTYENYNQYYQERVSNFIARKELTTWLSWSYAEDKAYKYFKKNNL